MLAYFPTPYPDELFYSLCARYAERMKFISERAIFVSLFNTIRPTTPIFLPTQLNKLVEQLPPGSGWTVEQIIDEHSVVPYVTAFLPQERVQRLRTILEQGGLGNPRHIAGLQGRLVDLPAYLRYCPLCISEDKKQYSEAYWRRLHQIPGVLVCPVHQVWLADSQVSTMTGYKLLKLVSAEQADLTAEARQVDPTDEIGQILLHLAREYVWLGAHPKLHVDTTNLREQYRVALIPRHLASPRGKIFTKQLYQAFQARYPTELLRRLQCELQPKIAHSWLARVISLNLLNSYPLYHLLLIHFLGFTLAEFLAQPTEYRPFGTGPWPCFNAVCPNYQQPSITEIQIDYKWNGQQPIGSFACPTCGFIYTRRGPDQSPSDYWQRSRHPLAYGPLWEAKLRELWLESSASYLRMANELGVGVTAIKNQAARLGLGVGPDGRRWQDEDAARPDRFTRRTMQQTTQREKYRTEWVAILANEPELNGDALIKKHNRLYEWLYRDDPNWLSEHRPPTPLLRPQQETLDWVALDAELCEQIRVAALQLRQQTEPFRRVSRLALEEQVGVRQGRMYNLEKLPRTAQALAEVNESTNDFACRRIWQTALKNCQAGVIPSRTTLCKQAGVAQLLNRPQIATALNDALGLLAQLPMDCMAIQARLASPGIYPGHQDAQAGETPSSTDSQKPSASTDQA